MDFSQFKWIQYRDPSGFSLEHPPGWRVQIPQPGAVMVTSPSGSSMALIQHLPGAPPASPEDVLREGRFPTAYLFGAAAPRRVQSTMPGTASAEVHFVLPGGVAGLARVTCTSRPGGARVIAHAAAASLFERDAATLEHITGSYRSAAVASALAPAPARPAPVEPPPLSFVTYPDPQAGTFTIDVPRGFQVRGGFNHAGLGDRRTFVEALSPEGIQILFGDPDCPQAFCHFATAPEDQFVVTSVGCVTLNLPPSAERLNAFYLKKIAPHRFGPVRVTSHRDRRDLTKAALERARNKGTPIPSNYKLHVHETCFTAGDRVGAVVGGCMCDPMSGMGFFTTWEGNVTVWLAPPALAARAEPIAMRMAETYQPTPQLFRIYQKDEAAIANQGAVALMNQQQWFAGQQAAYRSQQAAGDAIISGYWERQAQQERWAEQQAHQQQVYDRASQNQSDAMLDRQRLYDDAGGRQYDVASGSNYYWRDQQTDQVIGTETNTPPDYLRNYTLLRKL